MAAAPPALQRSPSCMHVALERRAEVENRPSVSRLRRVARVRRHGRCSRRCGGARWRIGRATCGAWARARWPAAGRGGRWRHHEQLARHRDVLITEANRLESAASEPGLRKVTGRVAGGDELRYRSSCRHHFSRSASSLRHQRRCSGGKMRCRDWAHHPLRAPWPSDRKHHLLCVEPPHDMQLVWCTPGVAQITTAVHTSGFEDGQVVNVSRATTFAYNVAGERPLLSEVHRTANSLSTGPFYLD